MVRILLVEDNEMNLDMLSRRLTRQGFKLLTAVDGQQALDIARSERPDVILMDMSLPLIDGWEATRQLRADAKTSNLRIIALTSHAMSGDREKAIAAGCDDYETKPIVLARLLEKIQMQIDRESAGIGSVENDGASKGGLERPRLAASSDRFIMLTSRCAEGAVEIWLSKDVMEDVFRLNGVLVSDRRRIVETNLDAIWRIAADRYATKMFSKVQRPNNENVVSILLEGRDLSASIGVQNDR